MKAGRRTLLHQLSVETVEEAVHRSFSTLCTVEPLACTKTRSRHTASAVVSATPRSVLRAPCEELTNRNTETRQDLATLSLLLRPKLPYHPTRLIRGHRPTPRPHHPYLPHPSSQILPHPLMHLLRPIMQRHNLNRHIWRSRPKPVRYPSRRYRFLPHDRYMRSPYRIRIPAQDRAKPLSKNESQPRSVTNWCNSITRRTTIAACRAPAPGISTSFPFHAAHHAAPPPATPGAPPPHSSSEAAVSNDLARTTRRRRCQYISVRCSF